MTNTEAAFSYTEKTPAGNLFTIRGDDYDEFFGNLTAVARDPELVGTLTEIHAALGHGAAGSVDRGNTGGQSPQQQPEQQQSGGGDCQHGTRVWKAFTSKAGKDLKGWFCPADDRMCKPQWK
tara:strand:- start:109 stop:474 length:366 start_codon:yes stop_codon:yes gene_type:complete